MTNHKKQPEKYGASYPWADWFSRLPVVLRRGKDYSYRTYSMAQAAYAAARRLGVRLTVGIAEDAKSLTLKAWEGKGRPRCPR